MAGILATQKLVRRLEPKGYATCKHTKGLWRHKCIPITFSLVVDNFGVKYEGKNNAKQLIHTTKEHYKMSKDWGGKRYCGISIKWNLQKMFSTHPCQNIYKRQYTSFSTVNQHGKSTQHAVVNNLTLEQPINFPRQMTQQEN